MRSSSVRLLVVFTAAAISACGDDGTTNPPAGSEPVASVSIGGPIKKLVPAEQLQLSALLRDASGAPLAEREVSWSGSDEAIVTVDQTGLLTAVSPGSATITATSEERTGTRAIEVLEGGWVGTEGGVVTAFGGEVRLDVPAGARTTPVAITITRASPVLDAASVVGSGFVLGPSGTDFTGGTLLTIRYDDAQAPSGVPEPDLRLHRIVGGKLQSVGGSVDAAANVATAEVAQLGTFGVRRPIPATPCSAAEHRQLDFWLGLWEIQVAGAPAGNPPPPSNITVEPGGCAIYEDFNNGTGVSLNLYDPASGNWHQTFVFSNGQRLVLVGGLEGSNMVMIRQPPPEGPGSIERWTWTVLSGDRVRQLQEVSTNAGQTFAPRFDGTYVRR
jgi:hypothetical protein